MGRAGGPSGPHQFIQQDPLVPCNVSALHPQVTQGIFTKIIEEIDRVDNSYGEERNCLLM